MFRFEETPEGLDIDIGAGDKEEFAHKFSTGDNVVVVEGELQNLQGKVMAVDGSKITIQPKHEDLKDEPLHFQASDLKKYFKQVTFFSFKLNNKDVYYLLKLHKYKIETNLHLCYVVHFKG